jgi:hypothetical protein
MLAQNRRSGPMEPAFKNDWREMGVPCLLGAAVNILGFGFQYGIGNHVFELAMLNWLRQPTLYPRDQIREAYLRFPTLFWRIIAHVPAQISTVAVLFIVFLATKLIFFYGLVKLARCASPDRYFSRGVAIFFALSPLLNIRSPFGYSPILDSIQTQTPLAIALMVCVGAFLVDGKWVRSAILAAACVYVNAIYVVYMLFPFAVLALTDIRRNSRQVLASAAAGAAIIVPWLVWNRSLVGTQYPPEYLPALLLYFPRHLVLSTHNRIDLLYGPVFLCIALAAVILAHRRGALINRRLEIMAVSFAVPVSLGVAAGQFHLTPVTASLQLMRADGFLFLYASILLAAALYLAAKTGALPYARVILVIAALVFVLPVTPMRFLLLLVGLGAAFRGPCADALRGVEIWLQQRLGPSQHLAKLSRAALPILILIILAASVGAASVDSRTWNTFVFSTPQGDWSAVQTWARMNTPGDSIFLVPPAASGFRIDSLRSSWGEWKDGTAIYLDHAFAPVYINRMNSLGVYKPPLIPSDPQSMPEIFKRLSFDYLRKVALENHLQYIVQYHWVKYAAKPLYSNSSYDIYSVGP